MRPIHEDQNTPERLSDRPGVAFLDFCHPMVILTAGWLSGKRSGALWFFGSDWRLEVIIGHIAGHTREAS